jgi:competence protein ComEC
LEAEQDRWSVWLPVLFGAGVAVYFALPVEPPLIWALAPLLAVAALRVLWRNGSIAMLAGGAIAAVALGFAAAKLRTDWLAAPVIAGQTGRVEVRGWVELVEPRAASGRRVTLVVSDIAGQPPEERPYRVRLRMGDTTPPLQPGDAIRVRAILSGPAGPALPGGYDFARSAWYQALGGVGYALAPATVDSDAGIAPLTIRMRAAIERVRQVIGARIRAALPGESGAIADALITGQRGGITDATNDAYRDAGLIHILSISGLHMVIMAGAVFLSVRFLLVLVPGLVLSFPVKKWAAAAATLAALAYLTISGASFPTVRSWIMISIMFMAVMLDRPAVALRNVALAALVILIVFPESLVDVSFQMSFAAVVALVSAYEIVRERNRNEPGERRGRVLTIALFFGGIVLTTVIASLAVAPFAAYHFHKSQQYAVLANLIAIPICNFIVMPAALATLVAMPLGLEWGPLKVMGLGIEAMTWCAYAVAALPGAVGAVPAMREAAFVLMLMGGLWLTLWRTRWRLLGLLPIALGLAVAPLREAPDLLIGRDGTLVAVRQGAQGLSAMAGKGGMFELGRWLEHDGDKRSPETAAAAQGFRCDAAGCVAEAGRRLVAVTRHPAAWRDDCEKAAIVIVALPGPLACTEGALVIGRDRLARLGAHAIYFSGETIRIETAADRRGNRPWAVAKTAATRNLRSGGAILASESD